MKRTRIEVLVDGVWREVDLFEDISIRYNKISNKIGEYSKRDLNHSNTFTIPNTSVNIDIFQLNRFNPAQMARSLNSRYECRYFLDEILFDFGFLAINNTKGGDISVNFLSQELDLVDKLRSTKWKDLFSDLQNYTNPNGTTQLATYLQQISAFDLETMGDAVVAPSEYTRGADGQVKFCLYPNTLNVIGDDFNELNGSRIDDAFMPLQSRPIFSMIGLIDAAFNVDGFTVNYDDGILDTLRSDYYVSDGLSEFAESVADSILADTIGIVQAQNDFPVFNSRDYDQFAQFDPSVFNTLNGSAFNGFDNIDNAILVPSASMGELVFRPFSGTTAGVNWFAVFEGLTPSDDVVFVEDSFIGGSSGNFTVNTIIENLPNPGASSNGNFIGYVLLSQSAFVQNLSGNVMELSVDNITMPIDQLGQFNVTAIPTGAVSSTIFYTVNLLELVPDKTLIEVIKPMLIRHGLLWDINTLDKTVLIYNYNRYANNIANSTDISQFFLDNEGLEYDTDYGKDYARVNNIGLDEPFRGNTYNFNADNNNDLSKYEEYKENHVEDLKDVTEVNFVDNSNTPYFEYSHEGEGAVSVDDPASQIDFEYRILRSNFIGGSFVPTNVPNGRIMPFFVQNVNYAVLPDGVRAWYNIIDNSVRVAGKFLFPPNFISNLDITLPVYVDQLNGYYIIEEVEEYVDGCNPVRVRLIKINL